MANKWIAHVKATAKAKNITYGAAIPIAAKTWKGGK